MLSLLEYIHRRCNRIAWRTERLSVRCGRETLHQLRVDIKRLRSVFRLLRDVDASFSYKKLYLPYKKIFVKGGVLREIQLQMHLLDSDRHADPAFKKYYRRYLNRQYATARDAFRHKARHMHFDDWDHLEEMMAPALHRCHPERIGRYFDALRTRIERHFKQIDKCSDEELHDLRKAIKDFEANRKLALRFFHFNAGHLNGILQSANKLQEEIGSWHDYLTACERLKNDIHRGDWPSAATTAGKKQLARWRRKTRYLRKKIEREVGRLSPGSS